MKQELWSFQALDDALQARAIRHSGAPVSGVAIDSRQVAPGDLFIALKGDPGPRFTVTERSDRDGDDFVEAAIAAGAGAVLTHRARPALAADQFLMDDTLDGLWQLGAARRAALTGTVIAITGSSGKTTCKTFLAAALNAFATVGSLNNHLGVPLSLARTPVGGRTAVYELGMNHPGEIEPLSKLVQPQLAVVLNVHTAHAEAFADSDGIRREKLSICAGLVGPRLLVVEDQVDLTGVDPAVQVVAFGESEAAAVRLLRYQGDRADYLVDGQELCATVPGGGRHRALTLAAVLAVMHALGKDLTPALALPNTLVPKGRGTRTLHRGIELLDDSYNANPGSMAAALQALREETGAGGRFALLGEMLELGSRSELEHLGLQGACEALDGVALVGQAMAPLARVLAPEQLLGWWPELTDEAFEAVSKILTDRLGSGDKLLIKGSNRVFWQREVPARLGDFLERAQN
ncbi:MAG: UDP-N-acetylmuramoyl-tripeptide--D-alanyl-D-alanine ligase [Pseudomonadales bacterium]